MNKPTLTKSVSVKGVLASLAVNLPSDEELLIKDRARQAANEEYLQSHPGAFVGVSLKSWLKIAQQAQVPLVPAQQIGSISREFVMMAEDEVADEAMAVKYQAFKQLQAQAPQGHMLRWDPCAAIHVKQAMAGISDGSCPDGAARLDLGDPRVYDILYEYPRDDVPILARPWAPAKMFEGYPVEFRVFIENSQVLGVANYYVQRCLPHSHEIMGWAQKAKECAEKMLHAMQATGQYPWMPRFGQSGFDCEQGQIHATMDFLVCRQTGQVLFLEAGPPFGAGAHPCAFEDEEEIHGIAL